MTAFQIELQVSLRPDILDPAGRAVESSLQAMAFAARDVRIGKLVRFNLEAADAEAARQQATEMAHALLANQVMEDFQITVSPQ